MRRFWRVEKNAFSSTPPGTLLQKKKKNKQKTKNNNLLFKSLTLGVCWKRQMQGRGQSGRVSPWRLEAKAVEICGSMLSLCRGAQSSD
ncbi:hypothetical protein LEMLEM_LOCUS13614 [Lemmus lemmus]